MQREKVEQLISILKLDKDGKLHRTSYGEVVIEKSFFFRADSDDLEIVRDIIKIMMDLFYLYVIGAQRAMVVEVNQHIFGQEKLLKN